MAAAVVERLVDRRYAAVLEPTCGVGEFLVAAGSAFPDAALLGFEVSPDHVEVARARVDPRARIALADCFTTDWPRVIAELPEPLLILGNPPWVTNAALGSLGSTNLPEKHNEAGEVGLDARTGKSNFDVSEWLLLRLLAATQGRDATLAMLCKSSVVRRLLGHAARRGWSLAGEVRAIDARRHFAASVDAVLLIVRPGEPRWRWYASLDAATPERTLGVIEGVIVDLDRANADLAGDSAIAWRSGIKHDCAKVMELRKREGHWINGFGDRVEIEPDLCFPLLKGSDLANARLTSERRMIVTQARIGADTAGIRERTPRTWEYLQSHREAFESRKSSIYRGQPEFSVFGVGEYTFAPAKVAIAALYKRLDFVVIDSCEGKPIVLDDTCYFLPCERRDRAEAIAAALAGPRAREFLDARVFWAAKRPITKALLRSLSLDKLLNESMDQDCK
ncbi:SAM-dependent DNA methyltransferase [Nannocystaceae bacterium ST9]